MRRYFTPRCIAMHVTLLLLIPVFAWLTWWQMSRALDGNALSWAYTFEWPLFGGYACYVWWQLIHDDPTAFQRVRSHATAESGGPEEEVGWALRGGRRHRTPSGLGSSESGSPELLEERSGVPAASRLAEDAAEDAAGDATEDAEENLELAEYNRYLAELNAAPDTRSW